MREWLKAERDRKRLTQAEVAKKLDMTESYYALIEAGKRQKRMDISLAMKISVLFDLPILRIIELVTEVKRPPGKRKE